MKQYPTISERSITLIINSLMAFAVFYFASGQFLPAGGVDSIWLACAVSYWFLALLSAPWFIPPRDAIIAAVGALLALVAMQFSAELKFVSELEVIRFWAITFSIAVAATAAIALFLHDQDAQSPVGQLAFRITGIFGKGEVLFSAPALLSIVAAYQSSFSVMVWLMLFWLLVVIAKPVERLAVAIRHFRDDRAELGTHETVGTISRIDHPNIVRVRLRSTSAWTPNRLFTVAMPDQTQCYVVSLFSQIQGSEVVGTGLRVATAQEHLRLTSGAVCSSHDDEMTAEFLERLSGATGARLVGFVVERSNIGTVTFEVAANSDLSEGDVVFARLSGQDVFYQIVGAETFEESFDQNPRGTHIVSATQLGIYSPADGFTKFTWLPSMNTPLFSAQGIQFDPPVVQEKEIKLGNVPSTNVQVVARLDDLIEYHTAVLGVTGTGKTEVALEIIRAAVDNKTKVFCVDFTGDYRARLENLSPLFPSPDRTKALEIEKLLATIDAYGFKAPEAKKKVRELLDEIRKETKNTIDSFLRDDQSYLAIFELAEISNSKAGLRLTEIYLSCIMEWARENRRERQILICLEEAHTIVPEAFGSGFDGETKWVVERIGQIALQGRKYGVGLMVITQRTALVSKTILSQCNTFLTHSLIDQTSLKFLDSVYSAQHTRLIPNLGKFEFLASGKAIKAERPILLRKEFDQAKLDASLAVRDVLAAQAAAEKKFKDDTASDAAKTDEGAAARASPKITRLDE